MSFKTFVKVKTEGLSLIDVFLVALLSIGWLLPNHYPPWNTFHSEAWIGVLLLGVAWWVLSRSKKSIQITPIIGTLFAFSLVPWIQYELGVLPVGTSALLGVCFILGSATAYLLGDCWGRLNPEGPARLVLLAALLASVGSVGIQIYQWIGLAQDLGFDDIWIFPFPGGSRPFANLAQPNQLASLHLWGLIGAAWCWHKKRIGAVGGTTLICFILFGVALTESRTAMLSLTCAVVLLFLWRPSFLASRIRFIFLLFYIYYLLALASIPLISGWLGQADSLTLFQRSAGELRFAIWRMCLDASLQAPWLGYGWNQTTNGFFQVYPEHPKLAEIYVAQGHSLILDLLLWVGWPLTILLLVGASWWLFRVVKAVSSAEQMMVVAALGTMLVHAMLEFPLHYGYFLWPFGLLAGAAGTVVRVERTITVSRGTLACLLTALSLVTGIIVRDYFLVEEKFVDLRFQLQKIGTPPDDISANTILLSAWPAFMGMTRAQPYDGMPAAEIDTWKNLLMFQTSAIAFRQLTMALALNHRFDEAKYWAVRSCSVMPARACNDLIQRVETLGHEPLSSHE